jgi:hypothetical protein
MFHEYPSVMGRAGKVGEDLEERSAIFMVVVMFLQRRPGTLIA